MRSSPASSSIRDSSTIRPTCPRTRATKRAMLEIARDAGVDLVFVPLGRRHLSARPRHDDRDWGRRRRVRGRPPARPFQRRGHRLSQAVLPGRARCRVPRPEGRAAGRRAPAARPRREPQSRDPRRADRARRGWLGACRRATRGCRPTSGAARWPFPARSPPASLRTSGRRPDRAGATRACGPRRRLCGGRVVRRPAHACRGRPGGRDPPDR